jgi:hypothetical protein
MERCRPPTLAATDQQKVLLTQSSGPVKTSRMAVP